MDKDIADLRAVAMGDDDFVFIGKIGNKVADFAGDFFLSGGGDFAFFLQGVAAKG